MSTQTLNHVALQTLSNYRAAAHSTVGAYRAGGHRLIGLIDGTLQGQLYPRTAKVAPRATERLDAVRGNVSAVVAKGIDQTADGTEWIIAMGVNAAEAQLNRVAGLAADIDNKMVATGVETAARLSLPVAQLALTVSTKMASRAAALADVAGRTPAAEVAATAAKAVKRAKRAVKTAVRRTKPEVKAAVKPQVKAVVRRARKAAAA